MVMAAGLPGALLLAASPIQGMQSFIEPEELPPLLWLCRQPTPPSPVALSEALAKAHHREQHSTTLLDARDRGGHTALWWACFHGHRHAVEALVQGTQS